MTRLALPLAALLWAAPCAAQFEQPPTSPMTTEMKQAILSFEAGKDDEAMDLFMDILVKGDPNEKALANDYLNRITRRITHGEHGAPPPSLPSVTPPPQTTPKPGEAPKPHFAEGGPEAPGGGRAEVMRKEIALKISQMRKAAMAALEDVPEVRVVEERGFAIGVGLPTTRLFSGDVNYKLPDAEPLLAAIGDLAFASGDAVIHVLPEGFVLNESRIQDLRRAMAVGSYLTKRGVSPARVKTQLVGTRVQVPNALNDFRGIVIVFANDEPLDLRAERVPDLTLGPPISLGVQPETLKVTKGEGLIIEFSVLEPPDGLASWKFQMLMPPVEGSTEMGVLQEVVGESPVFHQIFWNGRKSFFGEVLPFGRYVCILRARDLKGRESASKREVILERPAAPAPLARRAPVQLAPKPAPVAIRPAPRPRIAAGAAFAKRPRRHKIRRPAVGDDILESGTRKEPSPALAGEGARRAGEGASVPAAAASAAPEAAPASSAGLRVGGTVNYTVYFEKETVSIPNNGEKSLVQVSANLNQYPRAKVRVVGVAFKGEPSPGELAEKRASVVSGLLINQYGVDPGRIQQESRVGDAEEYKVDLYIIAQ